MARDGMGPQAPPHPSAEPPRRIVSSPSVVSLCSGIGGLEAALVGDVVATADTDPHCRAVLEARWPGVDQLDDWTTLDTLDPWSPDIVTAGLPCQPVSTAGMRRGADDKRWLFGDLAQLVGRSTARPHIFMENVPGIVHHAAAALDEFRRALANLGYRTSTVEITAAAACGAAHKRLRWFLLAQHSDNPAPVTPRPTAAESPATIAQTLPTLVASDSRSSGLRPNGSDRSLTDVLLRTLIASDRFGRGKNPAQGRLSDQLLPTLVAGDGSNGPGYRPDRETQNRLTARLLGRPTLLRTLTARDANVGTSPRKPQQQRLFDYLTITKQLLTDNGYGDEPSIDGDGRIVTWGKHTSAIARQGHCLGRPTPEQVQEPGRQRLDPAWCEWYMYQPPGAVADLVPSRHAIRILGNSVIPDHAAAALEALKAQPTLF